MTGRVPTHPTGAAGEMAPAARARRGRWWWIALTVIAGLTVASTGAEAIARAVVVQTIRDQVAAGFGVPVEQVDADVPGLVLRQLVAGSVDDARALVDGVSMGDAAHAPVSIDLRHVDPWSGTFGNGSATIHLTEDQVRALLAGAPGADAASFSLEDPYVTVAVSIPTGGGIPVLVSFSPTVSSGDMVLAPTRLNVAGADVGLDALRERFGISAGAAVPGWRICLAATLPDGLTLGSVAVDGAELVATFGLDSAILTEPDPGRRGTCAEDAVP